MKKEFKIVVVIVAILLILLLVWFLTRKESYNVTFMDSNQEISSIKVNEDGYVEEPTPLEKEGYIFLGWYVGDEKFDFANSTITEDTILEARWEKIEEQESKDEYTVTFDSNGGSTISSVKVEKDATVSKPTDPTREGYKFVSWQLDGKDYDFSSKVTEDITLVAKWRKTETTVDSNKVYYTVKFNSNGGSSVSSIKVEENTAIAKPTNPTRNGYKFVSWQLNGKNYNFSSKVTKNITLVAKWEKIEVPTKSYTVTFDSKGGSSVSSIKVEENTAIAKPTNPTRNGYKFVSWQLNGSDYNFSSKITKNITLVAKWEKIEVPAKSYTVTFDSNGGSSVSSIKVEENTAIAKPTNPTRNGYKFVSWQLNGSDYNFSSKVTKNITLVAKWEEVITYTYKVTNYSESDLQKKVTVYKNNVDITKDVSYIADSNGVNLGRYSYEAGAILVNKNEISRINKIKYNGQFILVEEI